MSRPIITTWALALATAGLTLTSAHPSDDWRVAKYTLNVKGGTGGDIQDFIGEYLCRSKTVCASDLGCENLRSWCLLSMPYSSEEFGGFMGELHFVDAPTLYDGTMDGTAGMDAWVDYFNELNGGDQGAGAGTGVGSLSFNSFMHNKIQLYTADLNEFDTKFRAADEGAGLPTLKRSSVDASGEAVAHLGIAISGRMFELVGPLSSVTDPDSYLPWSETTECAPVHVLPQPLLYYDALVELAEDDYEGEPSLMVVSIAMSLGTDPLPSGTVTNSSTDINTLYDHFARFTGAEVSVELDDEQAQCSSARISWESMDGLAVRYVWNRAATAGDKHTLAEYDDYMAANHVEFNTDDWYSWDHGLDQHIGMWYSNTDETTCLAMADQIRSALETTGINVGERSEPDAHEMYCGYAGAMTWEYQFQNCDAGRPEAPSECACIASNSLVDYAQATGNATCEQHADDDQWCKRAGWQHAIQA